MRRRFVFPVLVMLLTVGCGGQGQEATPSPTAEEEHAEPKCEPVGDASKATQKVDVKLQEYAVLPATPSTKAGLVHFAIENAGQEAHELVIVKADDPAALPTTTDGAFDEGRAPAGSVIGEVEPFPGGSRCDGTFQLAAGRYVLACNIVEREDDAVEAHFKLGMRTGFTVE